jgi:SAM-dependent methyltransferase
MSLAAAPLTPEADVLNLGCGRKKLPNAINVDVTARTSPEVVHDLNVRPWPFPEGGFREVHAYDVLEHLEDPLATLEEIHRVSRPGAQVFITVPHFSSANAHTDPTHKRFFGMGSFEYLTDEHGLNFYSDSRFRVLHQQLVFYPSLVNKLVWRLANRYPRAYEERWTWMFPAWFISLRLEVVKAPGAVAKP